MSISSLNSSSSSSWGHSGLSSSKMQKPPEEQLSRKEQKELDKLQDVISSLSEEDKAAAQNYMQNVQEAIIDGTFDAKDLADAAPDALKEAMEEEGLDLKDIIKDMDSNYQTAVANAPVNVDIESMTRFTIAVASASETDSEEVEKYMDKVHEAIESGDFDISALAAKAPDSLKTALEEQGLDMESMITDMYMNSPQNMPVVDYSSKLNGSSKPDNTYGMNLAILKTIFSGGADEE